MVETRSQRNQGVTNNGHNHHNNHHHNNDKDSQTTHHHDQSNPSPLSPSSKQITTSTRTFVAMSIIILISIITYPESLQPVGKPTLNHVWYFGWISALSTGLGVLPLVFSPDFDTYWVGVTNGKY